MSMDDCFLLYITPHDYLHIFDLEVNKLNFIVDVLKKNFSKSNLDSLRRISYKFKEEVFPYGSMVFHQNDPSNLFMIVKSGQIEISKIVYPGEIEQIDHQKQLKILQKKKQQEEEQKLKEEAQAQAKEKIKKKKKDTKYTIEEEEALNEYLKYYGDQNNQEEEQIQELNQVGNERQKEEENFQQKQIKIKSFKQKQFSVCSPIKYLKNNQCIKLGIVGPGEILGLEDYIQHKPRCFQAQSISTDTMIYYINKKKIDDIIDLNEDYNFKKAIKQNGNIKNDWYSNQQIKISKVSKVQDQKNEESASVISAKKRFGSQEQMDFQSVIKKLFNEHRTKLIDNSIRKEINSSPIRIKGFPTLNNQPQKQQQNDSNENKKNENLFDQYSIDGNIIMKPNIFQQKQIIISNINSPNENNNKEIALMNKKKPSNFQEHLNYSQIAINNDETIIKNNNLNNVEIQNNATNNVINKGNINNSNSSPDYQLPKIRLQINQENFRSNSLSPDKEFEYENRYRTLTQEDYIPKNQNITSDEPIKFTLKKDEKRLIRNDVQDHLNNIQNRGVQTQSQDALIKKRKNYGKELFRNYSLETDSLSLQQKIMYKISNNLILSQKHQKYNAENSKGFLEAKRLVKILKYPNHNNQSQSKNILKQFREERQLNASQLIQNSKNDSHNNSSILKLLIEPEEQDSPKKLNQQINNSKISEKQSQNNISLQQDSRINGSFLEDDNKQNLNLSQFPAILCSIQPNHYEIRNPFQNKQMRNNKSYKSLNQQMVNIEDKINSIQHFSTPKTSNINRLNGFSSKTSKNNQNDTLEQSHAHQSQDFIQQENKQMSNKIRFESPKKLNNINDISEINLEIFKNFPTSNRKIDLLPQLNNNNQNISQLLLNQKHGLSPQISFSVKMSRKGINSKFQNIFSQNVHQKDTQVAKSDVNKNNNSEQNMITVNKLDIADDLKYKVQIRKNKLHQLSSDDRINQKIIQKQRFPSVERDIPLQKNNEIKPTISKILNEINPLNQQSKNMKYQINIQQF